eukprot:CAMPEP_0197184074 /NCGR_PEP_ID=MMETSP1423-20130617/9126_1 /TAXON_ID=476441 /ORGANISM="Pseudo-nitzschia heimii, Strain UNC1101" /LENGTH=353 /DNA_ID=CAMNT_0042634797 /DNA_START=8 /DNA_END=1069 /DNA_ORIENTATION=-
MTNIEELENADDHEDDEDLEKWIPEYLKQFIIPYHDEFCYTRIYHYRLVAALMMEGFLPIATEGVILPKLHHKRCVVSLPDGLHVSKSVRKKSKKFRFTINQCFDRVVEACRQQHGTRCWLYPDLVETFKQIHDAGQVNSIVNPTANMTKTEEAPVRLYSIEVWNDESGKLVAGELGYTVGSIYTSLTGFSAQDSAGSVQLAGLGRLLCKIGFVLWDLGMDMEYKRSIGSHLMNRKDFVDHIVDVRVTQGHNRLPTTNTIGFNCKNLIDQNLTLETLFNGGEQLETDNTFLAKSRKVSKTDTDKQHRSCHDIKELKHFNTSSVHHDRSTPYNKNTSPPKKQRSDFRKQKVVAR